MRVVFNALTGLRRRTGIGQYTAQLMAELPKTATGDSVSLFPHGLLRLSIRPAEQIFALLPKVIQSRPSPPALPADKTSRGGLLGQARTLCANWYGNSFRRACARGHFDLYHEPNFVPLRCELPTVVTIHDLSVLLHPDWHPADRVAWFERRFRAGLQNATHLLTDAEAVRRQVIRHLGFAEDRVSAVHLGVGSEFRPLAPHVVAEMRARFGLPPSYLLFVGTIEPRKNILMLMQAFCALPPAIRQRCPLVLAGDWGWNFNTVRQYFESTARDCGVLHLGYVPAQTLPALYAGARALLFPSHYEGFGLPPLEMLACGGAVIASDIEVTREILANHAHFVAPLDRDGWMDAIHQVIADDDWRDGLCQGGIEYAGQFTWSRCARETWEVYRKAHFGVRGSRLAA
jgi:alpha-1,3-rhamnosyl/mannosyltransferase